MRASLAIDRAALTDLDPVSGGIANEKALETLGNSLFLDRRVLCQDGLLCACQVGHKEAHMALALRGSVWVDPDVKLQLANLEPSAAAASQFLGFGNFLQAQQGAIESEAFGFQRT